MVYSQNTATASPIHKLAGAANLAPAAVTGGADSEPEDAESVVLGKKVPDSLGTVVSALVGMPPPGAVPPGAVPAGVVDAGTTTVLVTVPPANPVVVTVAMESTFRLESRYSISNNPVVCGGGVTTTGVSVTVIGAAVTVTGGGSINPPVRVGAAYGGSNNPNRPQALQGYAQDRTCVGAARMGLHAESTRVAMTLGLTDFGHSVQRSARSSWDVVPVPLLAMVETS